MNENCCCGINSTWFIGVSQTIDKIYGAICNISSVDLSDVKDIKRMLAHNNPMTVAAQYPSVESNRFVVSSIDVRFLDMLNTNMFIIFKTDNIDYDLPVYFKDSVEYEHDVILSDGTRVIANQLQNNGIYSAKYQYNGGYIILDSLIPLNPDINI